MSNWWEGWAVQIARHLAEWWLTQPSDPSANRLSAKTEQSEREDEKYDPGIRCDTDPDHTPDPTK